MTHYAREQEVSALKCDVVAAEVNVHQRRRALDPSHQDLQAIIAKVVLSQVQMRNLVH